MISSISQLTEWIQTPWLSNFEKSQSCQELLLVDKELCLVGRVDDQNSVLSEFMSRHPFFQAGF